MEWGLGRIRSRHKHQTGPWTHGVSRDLKSFLKGNKPTVKDQGVRGQTWAPERKVWSPPFLAWVKGNQSRREHLFKKSYVGGKEMMCMI